MADKPYIPFEDELPKMSPKELLEFVYNWLWEGPLEYTPGEAQTHRLMEIIQSRPDAKACAKALRSCAEYLNPVESSSQKPTISAKKLDFDR
jgi:hypothetical protein